MAYVVCYLIETPVTASALRTDDPAHSLSDLARGKKWTRSRQELAGKEKDEREQTEAECGPRGAVTAETAR